MSLDPCGTGVRLQGPQQHGGCGEPGPAPQGLSGWEWLIHSSTAMGLGRGGQWESSAPTCEGWRDRGAAQHRLSRHDSGCCCQRCEGSFIPQPASSWSNTKYTDLSGMEKDTISCRSRVLDAHPCHPPHGCPSTRSWPWLSPPHTPSLTFPLHPCVADLPPAPRGSPLLPWGGSCSPTSPLRQGQMLQLQQLGTVPCSCQRKEAMRHSRRGSCAQGTSQALQKGLHLAPALPCMPCCHGPCTEPSLASSAQTGHICPPPSPHCSALPVCRQERRDGDPLAPVSQQNRPMLTGGPPGTHLSCSHGPLAHRACTSEALLSTLIAFKIDNQPHQGFISP